MNSNKDIFTPAVASMQASAIREIFKLIAKDDIISFAAGIPAPELFPAKQWAKITNDVLTNTPAPALVYGVTEGYVPLRELTKERAKKLGVYNEEVDELIMTSGAQQAIDLSAKVLLEVGDGVIIEKPSFIGSLNAFRSYGAKLYDVDIEDDGLNLSQVEEHLKNHKNIKFIYTIPTFQNPSGTTMSVNKRKALLELAKKYDVFILEDNPYGELRFKGEAVATIKSMDTEGRVIYAGTYSKTLAPGLRVGFVSARKDIVDRVVVVKQVNDVHTPVLNQMMVYEYIKNYDYDAHIQKCANEYGEKCALMISEMEKHFPEECTFTRPDGGIFILCTMPEGVDTKEVLGDAIENKVAFVPGNTFMADIDAPSNIFRLNFSVTTKESITKGIKILGDVLKKYV
ncbi:MAG: PLP-dependent aminotransferase family protein [Ruminococcaceae bacterium]|nr:PLP-dependent aminotransferase family protein [Oscillospiraceae bacterium]